MLIKFETQLKLPVMLRFCLQTYRFEQFVNVISNEQGVSQNAHDLNNRPSDFMLVLNDSDETVCDDGNMDLYAYGIFTLTPKSLDSEMLLDPFEEKFHLPAVPVEKCNLRSLEIEVVRVVRERPAEVWSIIDNPSDCGRIIAGISLAGKADSLVSNDIVSSFKDVIASLNLIVRTKLFPNDEEGSGPLDFIETGKVKIASVKHIARQLFILEPVHRFKIADIGIADSVKYRYFRSDVNLRMYLDSRLRASKLCPSEYGEAEVNGSGVNGIESSVQFEILGDAELLCSTDHVGGKLLVDSVISEIVGLGDDIPVGSSSSETEMIRAFSMGANYIREFPETGTACKLTEDKHKKVIPMSERPSLCPVVVPLHDTVELSLERSQHLLEYVLPCMHKHPMFDSGAKVCISKAGQHIVELNRCA